MTGRKLAKYLLGVVIVLLICRWMLSPSDDNPRGHIIWSLAVVRCPGPVEVTRIFLATTDAVFIPWGPAWWKRKHVGSGDAPLVALAADALGTIAAGSTDGRVFVSHDGGEQWEQYHVSEYPVTSIVIHGGEGALMVATFGDGIFDIKPGMYQHIDGPDSNIWCLARESYQSYVALTAKGVYHSQDDGQQWQQISGPSSTALCSQDGKGNLFAVNEGDLLFSNDGGRTTTRIDFGDGTALQAWSIATDESGDAVVGTSKGPYWSQDSGRTWKPLELSVNPLTAAFFSLAAPAWAQEKTSPDVSRSNLLGPTIMPPINTQLNLQSTSNFVMPSLGGGGRASDDERPRPDGGEDSGEGGGSGPVVYDQFPGSSVPCHKDSEGDMTCPASYVEKYLTDVGRSATITTAVSRLLTGHSVLVVGLEVGQGAVIQNSMQAIVSRMVDHVVLPIQAFAQATNRPVMMKEVLAHEAYVRRVGEEAVEESVQRVDSRSSGSGDSKRSDSRRKLNAPGPIFHQLMYTSVHGVGRL